MAISHAHLILLPLLTLFLLPTLRAVPFEICGRETDLFDITGVEMIQNGFKITGSSSEYIHGAKMKLRTSIDIYTVLDETYDLCTYTTPCPLEPGAFKILYDKIPPALSSIKMKVSIKIVGGRYGNELLCQFASVSTTVINKLGSLLKQFASPRTQSLALVYLDR